MVRNPITGESLNIRIGLHSGNVVAGVVGTLNSRFVDVNIFLWHIYISFNKY